MTDLNELMKPGGSTAALVFNVKSFGAKGDSNGTTGNGTDDTSALLAAIAAVSVLGGTLFFPPGNYRTTATSLPITASNVHVRGSGRGASNLFFDAPETTQSQLDSSVSRLVFDGGASSGTITNVSCCDVTVSQHVSIVYQGVGEGYNGQASNIAFRGCSRFLIDNCEAFGGPNFGIYAARSSDGLITRNFCHDQTADGVHLQFGCTRVTAAINHIVNVGDDGIGVGYEGTVNTDISILDNQIAGVGGSGVACYAPTDGLLVARNRISDTFIGGVKLNAVSASGSSAISRIGIHNNTILGAGTRSLIAYSRAQDSGAGIIVDAYTGAISDLEVTGNLIKGSWNGHIWVFGSGGFDQVNVSGNSCDTVAGVGSRGSAATGGGTAGGSTDGNYPGILVRNVRVAHVVNNIMKGAYHGGVLADSGNTLTRVADNTFDGVNTSASTASCIAVTSGKAVVHDNVMLGSGSTTLKTLTTALTDIGNVVGDAGGAGLPIADNFNRANVTPAVGGLGVTSTGAATWVNSAAGINGNQALFGSGSYSSAMVDCGATDVDISVDVVFNGHGARLYARTDAASAGPQIIYILSGSYAGIYFYDGSTLTEIGASGTAPSSGTHTMRLVCKGDVFTAYLDGAILSGPTTFPDATASGHFIGFGEESTGGTNRYDNFSAVAPA